VRLPNNRSKRAAVKKGELCEIQAGGSISKREAMRLTASFCEIKLNSLDVSRGKRRKKEKEGEIQSKDDRGYLRADSSLIICSER